MDPKHLINSALKVVKSNAPEILTAIGVSGVFTTAYLTHKAAHKVARDEDRDPWLSNKEFVKEYWKVYVPPVVAGALTVTCIIMASKASGRRTAAAVTAYSIIEKGFSEYKEKVIEEVGKGKERKIRDNLAQEAVDKTPPTSREVIIAGPGQVLCCELLTHRYFRSEMEKLRKAENDINQQVVHQYHVTLDEFYDLVGLPHTSISGNLGWDSTKLMELKFSTVISEDGEPCLAFEYNYTKPLR